MNAFTALAAAGRPHDDQLPPLPDHIVDALIAEIVEADTRLDQRPSVRRRPRRLVQAGLVAAASAGLLVTAMLTGRISTAEAQIWSAVPVVADHTRHSELEASCRKLEDTSAPAVITELRGSSSYTVLADSSQCLQLTAPAQAARESCGRGLYLPMSR